MIKKSSNNIDIPISKYLETILSDIKNSGGRGILIGGIVRDALMGFLSKDVDVEVYGLSSEQLEEILKKYADINSVGKSFGVIKFTGQDGIDYDFSLPRKDSKTGDKHKDFKTEIDPNLSFEEAFGRRDLTINSIGYDPIEKEIIDPYNGVEDIKNKVLRHTTEAFSEDVLRPLRVMQFVTRFPGFSVAPETIELIKSMKDLYQHLPKERVVEEFNKLISRGVVPGDALKFLYDSDWADNFPEIKGIKDVNQDPEWHPEGSVSTHTAYVMNEAARIATEKGLTGDDRAVLIYAALAHDFAKAHTTQLREKEGKMRWTAHGHEKEGGPLARKFLESIGVKREIISRVVPIVENHLAHIQFDDQTPPSRVKRLSDRLYPGTIEELANLIEADHSGRPPLQKELPQQAKIMLELAEKYDVHKGKPRLYLKGQDLLDLGLPPGKEIGDILKQLYDLQLNDKINSREEALSWAQNIAKNRLSILRGNDPIFNELNVPKINLKDILNSAYIAQTKNEFNDLESARNWVRNNYGVIEDINKLSNYLDNINLFKTADKLDKWKILLINNEFRN